MFLVAKWVNSLPYTTKSEQKPLQKTIQLSGIIWVIGSIIQCASVNVAMLVVGRVIAGFSVGMGRQCVSDPARC